MKIKKLKDTFNDYNLELSYGQLLAIQNALGAEHADPVADELFAELEWYLGNIPGPGESEEDLKKAEEAAESGMASEEAEGQPLKPHLGKADELMPEPEEEGAGAPPPGPQEEPAREEPAPGEEPADQHLPPPPEE